MCLSVFPLPLLMFCTALCLPNIFLFIVILKILKNILYYVFLSVQLSKIDLFLTLLPPFIF